MLKHENKALIGVDIGSTSVKLVELSGGPGSYELEAIALVAIENPESRSSYQKALSQLLESHPVDNKCAATSVCGSRVAVRDLHFPKLAPEEIEGAVRYEGNELIAFDVKDSYVDYAVLTDPDGAQDRTDVLFVAVSKPEVDFKTDVLESCGLEPRLVGVDMLVLLDALLIQGDLPETVAILNVGAKHTGIGVTRPGSPPFVRDLEIAGDMYTQAISEQMNVSYQQAELAKVAEAHPDPEIEQVIAGVNKQLTGELKRSIVYYQTRGHGARIEKVYLCGGSSRIPGLTEMAAEVLAIPVEPWSPIDDISVDSTRFDLPSVGQLAPFVGLATALAMKQDVS